MRRVFDFKAWHQVRKDPPEKSQDGFHHEVNQNP